MASRSNSKVQPLPDIDRLAAMRDEAALLEQAEAVMDRYLNETSYYRQTMLSISTAAASVWRKKVFANGPENTKDTLKAFLINIGLVSALLLGVSYTSAIQPVQNPDPNNSGNSVAVSVAAVFAGVSLVFSLMVIVVSVIYLIEVDNCTTDRDLRDFIHANAPFVDILTGVFSASVVCLLVSALSTMYVTYGRPEFLVVICVSGLVVVVGIVFASIVAGHNRFRLWVRYDSPEAIKMMSVIKGDEAQRLQELRMDLLFQIHELRDLKELMELKEVKEKVRIDAEALHQAAEKADTRSAAGLRI